MQCTKLLSADTEFCTDTTYNYIGTCYVIAFIVTVIMQAVVARVYSEIEIQATKSAGHIVSCDFECLLN